MYKTCKISRCDNETLPIRRTGSTMFLKKGYQCSSCIFEVFDTGYGPVVRSALLTPIPKFSAIIAAPYVRQ